MDRMDFVQLELLRRSQATCWRRSMQNPSTNVHEVAPGSCLGYTYRERSPSAFGDGQPFDLLVCFSSCRNGSGRPTSSQSIMFHHGYSQQRLNSSGYTVHQHGYGWQLWTLAVLPEGLLCSTMRRQGHPCLWALVIITLAQRACAFFAPLHSSRLPHVPFPSIELM